MDSRATRRWRGFFDAFFFRFWISPLVDDDIVLVRHPVDVELSKGKMRDPYRAPQIPRAVSHLPAYTDVSDTTSVQQTLMSATEQLAVTVAR